MGRQRQRDAAGPPARRSAAPTHNLMPGSPDVSEFPRSEWAASTRRALTNAPTEALRMGDRSRPARTARRARRIPCPCARRSHVVDSIVVCAGVRHGVELLTRVFGAAGPIAVEVYGLFIFRDAIAAMDIPTVPIGIDEHGAVISDLDQLEVPAVLLTPAHHSPMGMPLHPSRRTAVVEWAHRTDGYVLDDDYDGEFRYDRQPIGSLQALSPDRIVYLGSTSKSLSQTLRLGWMVVPDDLMDSVLAAAGGQQFYVDAVSQLTMADFIVSGQYDRHIRRMRGRYRRRRDALVEALADFKVGISGLSAGVNMLLTLPDGTEHAVLRRAGEAGIALKVCR